MRQTIRRVLALLATVAGGLLMLFGGGCLVAVGGEALTTGDWNLVTLAASLSAIPIAAGLALLYAGRRLWRER